MSLISLIVIIVAIGVILWAINTYIPMQPGIKKVLNIVVVVAVVLWVLSLFGVLPNLLQIQVGGN